MDERMAMWTDVPDAFDLFGPNLLEMFLEVILTQYIFEPYISYGYTIQIKRQCHCWRFWAVFPGLCFDILLAGLDTSIVATTLPTIAADLKTGALYIWAINGYFHTTAAVQPLLGLALDIFGRRSPMLLSIALFSLGSGLCGGAKTWPCWPC